MADVVEIRERDPDRIAPVRTLAGAWLASFSSDNTRQAYRRDLHDYFAFCDSHGIEPLAATRPVVDLYARSLDDQGKAASTVARRLSALASFYRYLVDEGVLPASPVERVRRPTASQESPMLGLDRNEARALLDTAALAGPRDEALVALLLLNGLRVSEALGLSAGDLDIERGHHIIRISGKGKKRRTAPLAPRTYAAVEAALAGRGDGAILLANDGTPMNRHQAHRAVVRLCRQAGITKRVSPHSLRHSMVTNALAAGVALHLVQDAAGHASPETTRRYDRARHSLDGHATYQLARHLASV